MLRLPRLALAAALAAVPALAVAGGMTMTTTGSPADEAFMDGMTTMDRAMDAARPTGDTDRDFVAMMLPHHEGAVAMAKVELQYGKDPLLRAMAGEIIASQDREIATMKAWQARNGR